MPLTIALALESNLSLRGGVNVLVEALIGRLADEFRIVLVSADPAGTKPAAIHPRIAAHVHWDLNISRRSINAFVAELLSHKVALVHFHGGTFCFGMRFLSTTPMAALKKAGLRIVITNHGWIAFVAAYCGDQKPLWLKLALLPVAWLSRVLALHSVDCLLTASEFTLHNEQRYYWPAKQKMRLMYHSQNRDNSAPPPPHEQREKLIVTVGHLAECKGQLILVEAFARIAPRFADWKLQIIGPPVEAEYAELVARAIAKHRLSGQVELLGQRLDAESFMRKASVFVQPSMREGFPLALQEAMFLSAACIGTDCVGNVELIHHEDTGMLTPKGDVANMAGALTKMLSEPELRKRLGAAARAFVQQRGLTLEAMVGHHRSLYLELLAKKADAFTKPRPINSPGTSL